jgi:hypothetical protein
MAANPIRDVVLCVDDDEAMTGDNRNSRLATVRIPDPTTN